MGQLRGSKKRTRSLKFSFCYSTISVTFSLSSWVQQCKSPTRRDCHKMCAVITVFKRYCISPPSMKADFSLCLPVRSFGWFPMWLETWTVNHFLSEFCLLQNRTALRCIYKYYLCVFLSVQAPERWMSLKERFSWIPSTPGHINKHNMTELSNTIWISPNDSTLWNPNTKHKMMQWVL